MALYQPIDPATAELINALLQANVLQLIIMIPVLLMALQLASAVAGFLKSRQESSNDDRVLNRILDMTDKANKNNERANENTAALTLAINRLTTAQIEAQAKNDQLERERIAVHQANRESILAQHEAVSGLSINVQNLGQNMLTWSKLHNDGMTEIRAELEGLTKELRTLQTDVKKPEFQAHLDKLVNHAIADISNKLDEILKRLPPPPPPPTEPDSKPAASKVTPIDADAAANNATVDARVPPGKKDVA